MLRNVARSSSPLLARCYSQGTGAAKPAGSSQAPITNVTGLTANCVKSSSEPVGPGASPSGQYKVPEYFSFNRFSFAEAEVEMAKYRCPQPSAVTK